MNENFAITFGAKIKPVKAVSDELTLCKCYVLALGKNRNRSVIEEPAVSEALPTLYNIPVVGHIYADAEGNTRMGGHDAVLEKDGDGKYKFRALTVPFGTVPNQDNVRYEEIEDRDGNKQNYLVADIILWTGRYPELKETVYSEDVYFGQSMEIKVKSTSQNQEDKNYTDIKRFTFSALCLLGKSDDESYHREPCFPDSRVEPYKFEFDDNYMLLFEEFKKELSRCFADPENIYEGERQMTQKDGEAAENTSEQASDTDAAMFAATYESKRNALYSALRGISHTGKETVTGYWLMDFDERYVYTERLFATEKDSTVTKGRMTYEMQKDETAIIHAASFETMLVKWLTVEESAALDAEREELALLSAYKTEKEAEERKRLYTAVLREFPELFDDADFQSLAKEAMRFESGDALREKLFALRGRKLLPAKEKAETKIPVDDKIVELILKMSSSVNKMQDNVAKVKEQTSAAHSKAEEKENTKINLSINQWLNKLIADTKASHAIYVVFHNGGKDMGGRYLQRMSIAHEAIDKYTVPIMGDLQNFPRTYLPVTMADRESAGHRYVEDIEEIKDTDPNAYQLCRPRGVKSFMVQCVQTSDKKNLGFIVLEFNSETDCKGSRTLQRKLRDVALKIGGVLEVTV